MTDDDKAMLDAKLYGMGILKNGKHVPIDDVYLDPRDARIEALSAENERLREAFKKPDAWLITDGETYWVTGFEPHPKDHPYCEIIPLYRAALGETK